MKYGKEETKSAFRHWSQNLDVFIQNIITTCTSGTDPVSKYLYEVQSLCLMFSKREMSINLGTMMTGESLLLKTTNHSGVAIATHGFIEFEHVNDVEGLVELDENDMDLDEDRLSNWQSDIDVIGIDSVNQWAKNTLETSVTSNGNPVMRLVAGRKRFIKVGFTN